MQADEQRSFFFLGGDLKENGSSVFKTLQENNDEEAELRIPTVIYLTILMICGIIGNTLVLIVYSLKYNQSNYKIFILCLAIVDMLACCVYMPTEIVDNRYPYMFYSEVACKICLFLGRISTNGSSFLLLVIAVDRFKRICRPLGSQLSPHSAKIMCFIALICSVLFAWPNAIVYGQKIKSFEGNVTGYACSVDDDIKNTDIPFIYNIILMVLFIVIFVILVISYSFIVVNTRKSFQFTRQFGTYLKSDKHHKPARTNKKVTKIMFAITLVFLLSYLPFFTLKTISTFKKGLIAPPSPLVLGLFPILSKSFFITNASNPFIYAIGDRRFRQNTKTIFRSLVRAVCKIDKSRDMQMTQNSLEAYSNQFSKASIGTVDELITR